jgi:hypothetical protein
MPWDGLIMSNKKYFFLMVYKEPKLALAKTGDFVKPHNKPWDTLSFDNGNCREDVLVLEEEIFGVGWDGADLPFCKILTEDGTFYVPSYDLDELFKWFDLRSEISSIMLKNKRNCS